MARPAEAPVLRAVPVRADLSEMQSRIRSGRTEGHYYVALLGLRGYEPLAVYRLVRKGLAYTSFLRFQRNTSLSARTIAELIQIPARTLTRRKAEGKLAPDESDRLVRASRIFGRAMELFEGDNDAARMWLISAQPALGGLVPLELARTDVGASEVENLVGRLEYGIPS
ncbi:MAG: antitoxin Xre/MbcA/ParS toxin-binding domain-containing protein [Gemmatimonadales bacterium]